MIFITYFENQGEQMRAKNIKPGDECPMVAVIWAILRGRGQMGHGPVAMRYEGEIVEAVHSFQVTAVAHNFEGLVADGEIGEKTIAALASYGSGVDLSQL